MQVVCLSYPQMWPSEPKWCKNNARRMRLTLLVWWEDCFLYETKAGQMWLFPSGEETFLWDQNLRTRLQHVTGFKGANAGIFIEQLCPLGTYLWFAEGDLKHQKTCVPLHWEVGMSHLEERKKDCDYDEYRWWVLLCIYLFFRNINKLTALYILFIFEEKEKSTWGLKISSVWL